MAYGKEKEGAIPVTEGSLRELVERYFEGSTSLGEEKALREYFVSAEEIPADLEYVRAMFGLFSGAAEEKSQRAFVAPEPEKGTESQSASASTNRKAGPIRRSRRILAWSGSVAAAVIAAIVISLSINREPATDTVYCYINGEPVTDYELAYAYTQGAFGLIEDNMKKPGEYLMPIEEMERSLESLRYLELLGLFAEDDN